MAISETYGYSGEMTTAQWPLISSRLGFRYAVHGANDCKISIASGGTRAVRMAPGWASGGGVTDYNDANMTLELDNVVSGSRWDLVGLRRLWDGGNSVTTLDFVKGTSAPMIPSRPTTPAAEDFQPLALVQVTAGQTVPTGIVDLRVVAANSGELIALDDLARSYLDEVGTVINVNGTSWLRTMDSSGVPRWDNRSVIPRVWRFGSFAPEFTGTFGGTNRRYYGTTIPQANCDRLFTIQAFAGVRIPSTGLWRFSVEICPTGSPNQPGNGTVLASQDMDTPTGNLRQEIAISVTHHVAAGTANRTIRCWISRISGSGTITVYDRAGLAFRADGFEVQPGNNW